MTPTFPAKPHHQMLLDQIVATLRQTRTRHVTLTLLFDGEQAGVNYTTHPTHQGGHTHLVSSLEPQQGIENALNTHGLRGSHYRIPFSHDFLQRVIGVECQLSPAEHHVPA